MEVDHRRSLLAIRQGLTDKRKQPSIAGLLLLIDYFFTQPLG
jgi:hypothetical protein